MVRDKEISKISNKRKYFIDHVFIGIRNMSNPLNWLLLIGICIGFQYVLKIEMPKTGLFIDNLLDSIWLFNKYAAFVFTILLALSCVIGRPWGSKAIEDGLQAAGFVNHLGVPPYLISIKKDKKNKKILIYNFKGNSIPLSKWDDMREDIEQSLNITIAKVSYAKGKDNVVVICTKARGDLPECIYWENRFMPKADSVYVIGEGVQGRITIDLDKIPHVIIGGSTGSGKTQLLRFLLMQAINKNEVVYIADLKGGIDYQHKWRSKTNLCVKEDDVIEILCKLNDELEQRKKILEGSNCHNISEYNSKFQKSIPRIIFACDEIAEILDSTGLSKEQKEKLKIIEAKLSSLARLGRAFSINLFLATQRPDADIMPGQVKANIDYRIAGRCDEPLSRVLGVPDAHKLVPKDIAGRFMLYDGTLFQAYLFDEEKDIH